LVVVETAASGTLMHPAAAGYTVTIGRVYGGDSQVMQIVSGDNIHTRTTTPLGRQKESRVSMLAPSKPGSVAEQFNLESWCYD